MTTPPRGFAHRLIRRDARTEQSRRFFVRSRACFEQLENRQLLSLTIDLRLAGGGKDITVDHVGQVVNLEAWAVVKGNNADISDEGLQILVGSFLSANTSGGGSVRGDLTATRVSPFTANGSTNAAQKDLDGDGDLDAGSNDDINADGFFAARSASVTTDGAPSALGGAEFEVANVKFTVTSLLSGGGITQLNYRTRTVNPAWTTALWQEDGGPPLKIPTTGTFATGTPVVVHSTGGSATGSISGTVFNDANQSGTRDSGESPLSSWTVFLDNNQDGNLGSGERSVVTDVQGHYNFDDLPAGAYHVAQVLHSGYAQIAPATERFEVALAAGEDRQNANFADSTLGQIRGIVYRDENENGKFEAGIDSPQGPGWRVFIDKNKNGQFDDGEVKADTDANGAYTLKLLAPGQYNVHAQPGSSAYFATAPNPRSVTVPSAGTIVTGENFGFGLTHGSISGTVYKDANTNDVQDSGDFPLINWLVWLDINNNAQFDDGFEPSTRTDDNGAYRFDAVDPVGYRVRASAIAPLRVVLPAEGAYDVEIDQFHQTFTNRNFLLTTKPPNGSISGTVWNDADGDGVKDAGEAVLPNWRVYLDTSLDGLLDGGEKSVLTDGSGVYHFTGLSAGTFRVRETLSAGFRRVTPGSGFYDVTIGESSGSISVSGKNFGNTKLAVIYGSVFKDVNGNGLRDSASEPSLSGWRIFDDANGNGLLDAGEASTLSDALGNYALNVGAGWHTVRVQSKAGFKLTTPLYYKVLVGDSTRVYNKLFGEKPLA
jgi:SdrD B-like domain